MADYSNIKAVDLGDIASLLQNGNPYQASNIAGGMRGNLSGAYVRPVNRQLEGYIDRSYDQTNDINATLNELYQGDQSNDLEKILAGVVNTQAQSNASNGYRGASNAVSNNYLQRFGLDTPMATDYSVNSDALYQTDQARKTDADMIRAHASQRAADAAMASANNEKWGSVTTDAYNNPVIKLNIMDRSPAEISALAKLAQETSLGNRSSGGVYSEPAAPLGAPPEASNAEVVNIKQNGGVPDPTQSNMSTAQAIQLSTDIGNQTRREESRFNDALVAANVQGLRATRPDEFDFDKAYITPGSEVILTIPSRDPQNPPIFINRETGQIIPQD